MKQILIAGIGSPFGADQLGWQVIDKLESDDLLRAYIPHQLQLCKLDRPGAGLIETLQGVNAAILIDAVQSDHLRGQIISIKGNQIQQTRNGLSSHGFGIAETLALGRAMHELPDELILLGMEVGTTPDIPFNSIQITQLANRICLYFTELLMR